MIRTTIIPCGLPQAEANALNRESGRIYTTTLITHYRVYRKKGTTRRHWLSPSAGEQLNDYLTRDDPALLHAHSKDAAQQGVYKAFTIARVNRQEGAKYPAKPKCWRTTIWKTTSIRREGDDLLLARARGQPVIRVRLPVVLTNDAWPDVREVRLVWDRVARHYTWHLVIENGRTPLPAPGSNIVAVDLGEIHPAACTDGVETVIITARALRATRQYTAKRLATLHQQQARKVKGSRRWWRVQRRKNRFLAKQQRRQRDIEHKVTRAVVQVAVEREAATLAIGDVRTVADGKRLRTKSQQKVSTWTHGRQRAYITYKAAAKGIRVELVDEHYSSQTCPNQECMRRHKPTGRSYCCPDCGFQAHRDAVGAANLLSRFRFGTLGQVVPPPDTKYRRPAAVGKRSMRSRLDTGQMESSALSVARGNPREASGL